MNAAVGLVLGLGVGLALAAVASVVRDRPVLRRDIAAHLGASVIVQLPAPRRGPARLWRRSRAASERERVAATLARAVLGTPGAVSLLELGCPQTAAALALDMAEELATEGSVTVINDLRGEDLRKLAGETASPVRLVDGAGSLAVEPSSIQGQEYLIGVGSVGPGTAWMDLGRLGSETLLVVRAGHADTLWLHTVARQLADAEIAVIGVVLVHPDPRDRSDGTLWDALNTALRGRTAATPRQRGTESTPDHAEPAVAETRPFTNGVAVAETRPFTNGAAANTRASANGAAVARAPVDASRRPSPRPRPAGGTGRPSPRRRPVDIDGFPTDKFPPVAASKPVDHREVR